MAGTILLVEDEPSHVKLFTDFLRVMGWEIVTARTAKQALDIAPGLQPAAILLDILLPDIDGRLLIAELRRIPVLAQTPILAISATPEPRAKEECITAGANLYMAKPVSLRDLGFRLKALVESRAAGHP